MIYKKYDKYNCPYQRVEYIQGNGAQINVQTNISVNDLNNASYIEYTTDCIIPNNINGAEGKNQTYFFIGTSSNKFYSGCGSVWQTSSTLNDGNRHIIKLIKENTQCKLYLDNNIIDSYNFYSRAGLENFGMFCCIDYSAHLNNQKKYYAKLQINDNILFEMIPVRIKEIGYMYDTVTKQLYGTNNLSNFIIGSDL